MWGGVVVNEVNKLLEECDKTVLKAHKKLRQLINIQKDKPKKPNQKRTETKNQDIMNGTLCFCQRNQLMEQSEQLMK